MPFGKKDTDIYRRDAKTGGKLLSADDRIKLLKVRYVLSKYKLFTSNQSLAILART